MKMQKKRGFLAAASAVLTALTLSFGSAASAAPSTPANPPAASDVTITKLTQPTVEGDHASGKPQNPLPGGTSAIEGVTFDYYLVPGTAEGEANDIGTNVGQAWAATQTVATLAGGLPATETGSFTSTNSSGVTTKNLPRGLYVVRESVVPAGVTPAPDFTLAVPLTDPDDLNAWLDHIYVYPKNSLIAGSKTVVDGEGATPNFTVGGKVTWTIKTDIPRVANDAPGATDRYKATDAFEIHDTLIDANLSAVASDITVTGMTVDDDYTVTPDTSVTGETTWKIVFTADGRDKLAAAVNADASAQVEVKLVTTVESVGETINQAVIYPDQKSITENKPLDVPGATIKYGNYQLNKKSTDTQLANLSGAEFKVYLSEADAKAGTNAVTTKENATGVWTTTADGTVTVGGLRYTNWADGETATGAKVQEYWLVETKALDGHQLLAQPIKFVVDENSAAQTAQTIVNAKTENGGFELPLTGGTGTAMLTFGGVLLLSAVLVVARRRRVAEVA
ncbi:MAG: SpaH/EbpB family LPXTG-anchored major pilin [Ancrocorticia sp.]